MIYINLLNLRLKEMNQLVYDFSRDKSSDDVLKQNADLIRSLDLVKSEKMMLDAELKKYKEAIDRQKIRKSIPKKHGDDPSSPDSFEFDGQNELFGDSFVIDTGNKEMEDRIEALQSQINVLEQTDSDKQELIKKMQQTIDELEADVTKHGGPSSLTSDSFEMTNSNSMNHIKEVLLQFLRKVPISDPGNEELLTIVFNMLRMKPNEIDEIRTSRENLSKNKGTPQKKSSGGVFGGLFKKNK